MNRKSLQYCIQWLLCLTVGFLVFQGERGADAQTVESRSGLPRSCEMMLPDKEFVKEMLRDSQTGKIEKRMALVIGNGDYETFQKLPNARNDAIAVAKRLTLLGFEVVRGIDLTTTNQERCLGEFFRNVREADVALFYYAGHAIQENDVNHFVFVDAKTDDPESMGYLQIDTIIKKMKKRRGPNLIFLDACRTSKSDREAIISMNGVKVRSLGRGLGPSNLVKKNKESGGGIFLAYATSPNNVAEDGDKDATHSPFTKAFIKHVGTSGYSVSRLMSAISKDVGEETEYQQSPWMRSSLSESFYFNGLVDIDGLVKASEIQANISKDFLKKGKKIKAIEAALLGFPKHFSKQNEQKFSKAYRALYMAMGSKLISLPVGKDENITATLSDDGKLLVTTNLVNDEGRRITLWDVESEKMIKVLGRGDVEGGIRGWDFRSDGEQLVSLANDGFIEIWDSTSGEMVLSWDARSRRSSWPPRYSPDNTKIITVNSKGTLWIWDAKTGELVQDIPNKKKMAPLRMPRIDPKTNPKEYMKEARNMAKAMAGNIQLFAYPKFLPNGFGVSAAIQHGAAHPGHDPVTISVWDIATKKQTIEFKGYEGWVPEYSFSKDGRYLAAGPEGHMVHLWDIQTGEMLYVWKHDRPVEFVLFSPDGNRVVTYPSGGPLRYWDTQTGNELKDFPIDQTLPYTALFSEDESELMFLKPEGEKFWESGPIGQSLLDKATLEIDERDKKTLEEKRIKYWLISENAKASEQVLN